MNAFGCTTISLVTLSGTRPCRPEVFPPIAEAPAQVLRYTRGLNRRHYRSGHLFENRFKS